jgi:hypothetical protein
MSYVAMLPLLSQMKKRIGAALHVERNDSCIPVGHRYCERNPFAPSAFPHPSILVGGAEGTDELFTAICTTCPGTA